MDSLSPYSVIWNQAAQAMIVDVSYSSTVLEGLRSHQLLSVNGSSNLQILAKIRISILDDVFLFSYFRGSLDTGR